MVGSGNNNNNNNDNNNSNELIFLENIELYLDLQKSY
jgi:hypothetical protein